MKKTQAEPRSEERRTSIPFDSLRSGVARQHAEIAISDPNSPRIHPTLPRLKFCDEADSS
jgi:hypothetical protein